MSDRVPLLSVVVPVHNGASTLPQVLSALAATDLPREEWELVVVDDASNDESAALAARFAQAVVRIPTRPHGPAYARNRGVEVAKGSLIVFIDADVVVRSDTLRRFRDVLVDDPTLGAVFGSYDCSPPAPSLVSQYRNLLHHYTHQLGAGERDTFWAGAGAVRRSAFEEAGMYDEWHYPRPQIEDIELGGRLARLGHRIVLRPDIQATHLKRWTLVGGIRTDLRDRGIPWARLLLHRGEFTRSGGLNLRWTEKAATVLVWLALLLLFAAAWWRSWPLAGGAAACAAGVVAANLPLLRFFTRVRSLSFAVRVIPLQLLYHGLNGISFGVAWFLRELVGAPLQDPLVEAYAELGVTRWPPIPSKERPSSWHPNGT
jgi:hypothetical protein